MTKLSRLALLLFTLLALGCAHQTTNQADAASERAMKAEALREEGLELMYSKDPRVKDTKKAFQKLLESAELGDPVAMDSVGGFYGMGLGGMEKDCAKAMEWFARSAASGYALAANNLAYLYVTCPDKKLRDIAKAEEIMRGIFLHNPTLSALLDTYAAVLASQGEFAKAVATMQVVVDVEELMDMNPEQIDEAKSTLALYKKHKLLSSEPTQKDAGKKAK